MTALEPVIISSPSSVSRLRETYAKPEFRRAWDNDAQNRLASQLLHLRRFRGESQSEVASAAGTSQSAIARIEGGQENITVSTLEKLINALRGRLYVAIYPEEFNFPRLPNWWELASNALPSDYFGAATKTASDGCVWSAHLWKTSQPILQTHTETAMLADAAS